MVPQGWREDFPDGVQLLQYLRPEIINDATIFRNATDEDRRTYKEHLRNVIRDCSERVYKFERESKRADISEMANIDKSVKELRQRIVTAKAKLAKV